MPTRCNWKDSSAMRSKVDWGLETVMKLLARWHMGFSVRQLSRPVQMFTTQTTPLQNTATIRSTEHNPFPQLQTWTRSLVKASSRCKMRSSGKRYSRWSRQSSGIGRWCKRKWAYSRLLMMIHLKNSISSTRCLPLSIAPISPETKMSVATVTLRSQDSRQLRKKILESWNSC